MNRPIIEALVMIEFACHSDPGRLHHENQDRWFADADKGLFLVTDGMANAIAPKKVIERFPLLDEFSLPNNADLSSAELHQQLQKALQDLSEQVYEEMAAHGELGLGATLVLAVIREQQALLAHIGDSRIYLYRQRALKQLTRDHSVVERLVDMGSITRAEADEARGNGGPTRFLGQVDEVEAEFQVLELQARDQLILCSDGLTEMLRDEEIAAVMQKEMCPEDVCQHLVDAANDAGGRDNVTVLVVRQVG